MPNPTIHWFRGDLRLDDNPALAEAARGASKLLPLYVIDERWLGHGHFGFPRMGPFRARFLLESLHELRASLRAIGSDLVVRRGDPVAIVAELAGQDANVYTQAEAAHEEALDEAALRSRLGPRLHTRWQSTLVGLEDLPFRGAADCPDIFTTFRKEVERRSTLRAPLDAPRVLPPLPAIDAGPIPTLVELGLAEPAADPRAPIALTGGERAALARLRAWMWEGDCLRRYKETRNGLVGADYSSRFSPWLAHGCLSPRRIHAEVRHYERERVANDSTYWLVFELLWRDFFRFQAAKQGARLFRAGGPRGIQSTACLAEKDFTRWASGQTGWPLVDAGMRELAATGFLSNRARQNVASFLVREMGQPWLAGAEWFENLLLDYDPCSNYGNWAYVAGVGCDPREDRWFNTVKQSRDYDPRGEYLRLWVPETGKRPEGSLHEPLPGAFRSGWNPPRR